MPLEPKIRRNLIAISAVCILWLVSYLLIVCLKIVIPGNMFSMLYLPVGMFVLTLNYVRNTPYFRANFSKRTELICVGGATAVAVAVIVLRPMAYKIWPHWLLLLPPTIMMCPTLFFSLKLIFADKADS